MNRLESRHDSCTKIKCHFVSLDSSCPRIFYHTTLFRKSLFKIKSREFQAELPDPYWYLQIVPKIRTCFWNRQTTKIRRLKYFYYKCRTAKKQSDIFHKISSFFFYWTQWEPSTQQTILPSITIDHSYHNNVSFPKIRRTASSKK